jgi:small nuclear ribonucleoprotein (snRNP)-like protein
MSSFDGEFEGRMLGVENKVVVRFRDGRMVKGYTHDFNPNRESFHVSEVQEGGTVIEVSTSLLKAVFFVKTFEGNKDHRGSDEFSMESLKNVPGLKVKVTFSDGEVMYGSTHGYAPERKGFFIFPADKKSNNDRAFIIVESTDEVETWR